MHARAGGRRLAATYLPKCTYLDLTTWAWVLRHQQARVRHASARELHWRLRLPKRDLHVDHPRQRRLRVQVLSLRMRVQCACETMCRGGT